jgi:dipeptidyl-peptidase-4
VRTLVDNAELRHASARSRGSVEFFRVPGAGGAPVRSDGWMIKPPGFDSTKKYPVLFTSTSRWGKRCKTRGAADSILAPHAPQQAAIIASVDTGTPPPRGRSWQIHLSEDRHSRDGRSNQSGARTRTPALYRLDAHRRLGLERRRFNDANLLFRSPDVYRMGMSVAPVTDLRYYDTIYTERCMGLPQPNAEDIVRRRR